MLLLLECAGLEAAELAAAGGELMPSSDVSRSLIPQDSLIS